MVEKLRKELRELAEQQRRRDSVEKEADRLRQQEDALWREEYMARTKCSRIKGEMEALETFSLRSFWLGLTGQKEELLEALGLQLREAEVEHKDIESAMKECRLHLRSQEAAIGGFGDLNRRYQEVWDKLKQAVKESGGPEGEETGRLDHAVQALDREIRETEQALGAGGLALQAVRSVMMTLEEARKYGDLDMAGSSRMGSSAKHKVLERTREQIEQLRERITAFNSASRDVRVAFELGKAEVGGYLKTSDFVFDGLIIDWTVRRQIGEAARGVAEVENKLRYAVDRLEEMRRTLSLTRDLLEEKLDILVLGQKEAV